MIQSQDMMEKLMEKDERSKVASQVRMETNVYGQSSCVISRYAKKEQRSYLCLNSCFIYIYRVTLGESARVNCQVPVE